MPDAGNGRSPVPTPNLSPEPSAEFPLEIPRDLLWLTPRYEFVRELGRGMAVVYLAREREGTSGDAAGVPGREVAVKVVAPPHAGDRETTGRFAREARTATALSHPNIVRTLAIETSGDAVAIITEYISGQTLRALLQDRGALPFSRAAAILRDVASALAHAHGARIVHRDVKPENIFIETGTGRALLGDFGIARSIDADALLTHDGASLGTPAYMAPEQVDGLQVDERTDVYALGLLGWEMLAGRRPWQGETLYALLQKQKTEPLPDLARLRPDVPVFLHRAIAGALAKDPAARWRDAQEMLAQLSPEPEQLPDAQPSEALTAANAPEAVTGATIRFHSGEVDAVAVPTGERGEPGLAVSTADYLRDRAAVARLPARPRQRRRWIGAIVAAAALAGAALAITHDAGPPSSGDPQLDSLLARATPPGARGAPRGAASAAPDSTVSDTLRRAAGGATIPSAASPRQDSAARDSFRRDSASGAVAADAPDSLALTNPTPSHAPVRVPAAAAAATAAGAVAAVPRATAGRAAPRPASQDACRSTANVDQRRCLMSLIYRSDASLQRTYDALIRSLRQRAGGAAEPPTVRALRAEQRAWVDARDRECAREIPISRDARWGVARAPCFSGFSSRRAALLAARLRGRVPMAR